jgi:hypothetical protein
MVPWEDFDEDYAKNFKKTSRREVAYSVRIALGALIIKEQLGLTDEETVYQISENPYLQFFLGFKRFEQKVPFDTSQLTHFRKRFPADILNRLNEKVISNLSKRDDDENEV